MLKLACMRAYTKNVDLDNKNKIADTFECNQMNENFSLNIFNRVQSDSCLIE